MLRLCYFGALLGIAVSLCAPAISQTGATNGARVQHVLVRGSGAAMEVEIQTSGAPVAPDTQAITGPDRIVVDFPGALPAAELRALQVNRGALKRVRAGLFFSNPPITRIVLDLTEPRSYQISTGQNAVVIKLGQGRPGLVNSSQVNSSQVTAAGVQTPEVATRPAARLQSAQVQHGTLQNAARLNTTAPSNVKLASATMDASVSHAVPQAASQMVSQTAGAALPVVANAVPPAPRVTVSYDGGMLRIRAERATLAEVLFEVQRQTQAEIAIPAGAEQEDVVADLGPASAQDVLAALLNGSRYNFIFVGDELTLERVILTRRD